MNHLLITYEYDAVSKVGNVSHLMAWWTSGYIDEGNANEPRT